ncbi:MAG: aldo/keto reductase [Halobacteriota archaeon]
MTALDLPAIGLGTSGNDRPEQCARSVERALEVGYRHIDTAQMYDNEAYVGEGIQRSDVPREEVVIATKVHPDNLGYDDAIETAHASLERLGVETVDMLYVHWPTNAYDPEETLAAFDELHEAGVMDHLCVSNFTPELLAEAREYLSTPIAANQVECHPLLRQEELRRHARKHGHYVVAYSPLGQGEILAEPELVAIADRHDTTPAAVCLAWAFQTETVVPIPKATGEHIRANWEAQQLELTREDVNEIENIDRQRRVVDPDRAPWNE